MSWKRSPAKVRTRSLTALLAAIAAAMGVVPSAASTGDVATGFHGDGIATAAVPAAVDASDRILTFAVTAPVSDDTSFAVRRLSRAGLPDATFGTSGVKRVGFGGRSYSLAAATSATHVFVVGTNPIREDWLRLAVARLDRFGAYDSSFSGDGRSGIDVAPGLRGALVDAATPIVDGGLGVTFLTSGPQGRPERWAVRWSETGAPFRRLATDGTFRLPGNAIDAAFSPSGRLYVVARIPSAPQGQYRLLRFAASGAVDRSFADNGVVTFGECSDLPTVMIDSQGLPTVACPRRNQPGWLTLRRYTSSGAPDVRFGGTGRAARHACCMVALDSNGRVVISGSGYDTTIVRLDRSGRLDTSFSGDGSATIVDFAAENSMNAGTNRIYLVDSDRRTLAVVA